MPVVERSRRAMGAVFAEKIDELVDRSHGQIRADAAYAKLVAIGYLGSDGRPGDGSRSPSGGAVASTGGGRGRGFRSRGCGCSGTERRDALWSRAVVRDHRGGPVAAGSCKLGAAYPVETDG